MVETQHDRRLRWNVPLEPIHIAGAIAGAAWVTRQAIQAGVQPTYLVAWCIGLLIMGGAARVPVIGLFVFVAINYGMPRYHGDYILMLQLGVTTWLSVLAITGTAIWMIHHRQESSQRGTPWVVWVMAMFVGWLAVSAAASALRGERWNPHPKHHPRQYVEGLIMLFLASRLLAGEARSRLFALALCVTVCVRALWAGSAGIYREGDISALAVLAMPVALFGVVGSRGGLRVGFVVLLGSLGWVLSLTYNRAAAVGFVVLLPVLWVQSRYKWRVLALATPLLIAGGIVFASSEYGQRFANLWERGEDRATARIRLEIWQAGWQMFVDHPVTGVGPGNFHNLVCVYNPKLAENYAAHNNFVGVLAEGGLPGLVLYVFLFVGGLGMLWRIGVVAGHRWPGNGAKAVFAALSVYLATGCFISRQDMVLAYLLLGWAVAMHRDLTDPDAGECITD